MLRIIALEKKTRAQNGKLASVSEEEDDQGCCNLRRYRRSGEVLKAPAHFLRLPGGATGGVPREFVRSRGHPLASSQASLACTQCQFRIGAFFLNLPPFIFIFSNSEDKGRSEMEVQRPFIPSSVPPPSDLGGENSGRLSPFCTVHPTQTCATRLRCAQHKDSWRRFLLPKGREVCGQLGEPRGRVIQGEEGCSGNGKPCISHSL